MGLIRFLFHRVVIVLVVGLVVAVLPSAELNHASASRLLQHSHARQRLDKNIAVVPEGSTGWRYTLFQPGQMPTDGFQSPGYDDSDWQLGIGAFAEGYGTGSNCVSPVRTDWPENQDIIIRRSFSLPAGAHTLSVWVAVDDNAEAWINGYGISGGLQNDGSVCNSWLTFKVPDNILKAGRNVVIIHANNAGGGNTYLDAAVTAYVPPHAAIPAAPVTHGPQVAVLSPVANIPVAAGSKVVFLWKPFRGAVNYALHIWLVKQAGTVTIGPGVPTEFSTTIYGRTDYGWNDQRFLPGLYQYSLLPLDRHGNPLAAWSKATQFQVVNA